MNDGRVAIIGDIHGHADELIAKLVRLGMDPDTLMLPEDLTVIQLGDLIHRGLQSSKVLRTVDTIMDQQPTQWISAHRQPRSPVRLREAVRVGRRARG